MSPQLDAPAAPRSPWQLLYGNVHRLRRAWYRRRAERLPSPVISIGNLHWGGSGKTPLTAAVAAHMRDAGHRVCILSRGHGRRGTGIRVVSSGDGPLLTPDLAGDEPVLLAEELPGVAVVVGRRRALAGRAALELLAPPPELFVLDDGFSHLALHRDLDILVFPATDPFGGGRLAPSGRLREPLAASARASAAVLTGLDSAADDAESGRHLASALHPHGFRGPGFASFVVPQPPRFADGQPLPAAARVLLVAGIARPGRFFAGARRAGVEVVGELAFRDHHRYPPRSVEEIDRTAATLGAEAVLTTTKDRVKLAGRLAVPLAELPVAERPAEDFWRWLEDRLGVLAPGGPATAGSGPGGGEGR
ncbi:MAG TPA: tetraacyldisaccharide 4'-kinase [Thermoanaerobaculia bacterium]|nr:tetraacyldisaccharide 4'-kinase [Thermoanaerobaculia bacterium]